MKPLPYLLALLAFTVPLSAQVNTASLTGLITDPSGSIVPTAKVTAHNRATNLERTSQSLRSHSGRRRLPKCHTNLNLETAQKGRADFKLGVSQLQSAVTVQAAATQLAPQDAALSSVVGNT